MCRKIPIVHQEQTYTYILHTLLLCQLYCCIDLFCFGFSLTQLLVFTCVPFKTQTNCSGASARWHTYLDNISPLSVSIAVKSQKQNIWFISLQPGNSRISRNIEGREGYVRMLSAAMFSDLLKKKKQFLDMLLDKDWPMQVIEKRLPMKHHRGRLYIAVAAQTQTSGQIQLCLQSRVNSEKRLLPAQIHKHRSYCSVCFINC